VIGVHSTSSRHFNQKPSASLRGGHIGIAVDVDAIAVVGQLD
jgi:hypothetical protein